MRSKRALIIFLTDVLPLMIVSILGIYKLKLFINILGEETLGLYQLFSQIMIYLALVDGGLSSAVLYSMYKPNADKNNKKLSEIFYGAKKVFNFIGILVFLLAALFSPFAHYLIKDSIFGNSYIALTFLLFSLSSVIQYFFVPYQAYIEVKEEKYIVNISLQGGQILQNVLEIILLLSGVKFEYILLMHSIIKLISNLIIYIIFNRKHSKLIIRNSKPDKSFKKSIGPLFFHKINGLIGSNIDILIISKILGLANVAIYSVYRYITNMIETIIGKLSTSIIALVGNYVFEDKKDSEALYYEINSMNFFLGTIIAVPLFFALNPFINIWYEGSIQTSNLLCAAFVINTFIFIIKKTTIVFIHANGYFKETRFCALTDTVVNLTLSLILIKVLGMPGVVFATAFSVFLAEYILKTIVLFKKFFHKNAIKYFSNNIKFFAIAGLDFVLGYLLVKFISFNNIGQWFLIFACYFVINALFVLFIYKVIREDKFVERLKKIVGAKK